MAETQSDPSPTGPQTASGSDPDPSLYWCYNCDKRVAIETLSDLPDVVCYECKNGFVESISATAVPTASDAIDDPAFSDQFIQVLRLISQYARQEDAPPPPPSAPSDEDYLGIELDGWNSNDEEDEDDDYDEHSVEIVHEEEDDRQHSVNGGSEVEDFEENDLVDPRGEEEEEEFLRRWRDGLSHRLRDYAMRAAIRRNRILDWAEILMGLEDHSFELRRQAPESDDAFVGNPGDYVDAAGYEALLQNLAESDNGGRRGAPPASKAAVEGLESVVIGKEDDVMVCAICKDSVNVGEVTKNLPCGHGYHCECIVPWLRARNSCPVCRFELPTDDPEYEEERRKRVTGFRATSSYSHGGSSGIE